MKTKALKRVAKKLRENQTSYERLFAQKLSAWGVHHKPQAIVGPWIADFLLPDYDLIVEIDGAQHFRRPGIIRDKLRDDWFDRNKYRVVHIANGEVARFEFDELFNTGKNGPVVEELGLPAYLAEFVE